MKTVIQLIILGLIINAAVQPARSYWNFYDFKDAVQTVTMHGRELKTSELRNKIISIGEEYGFTVDPANIHISREHPNTNVEFSLVDEVWFVPRFYSKQWLWEASISVPRQRPHTDDLGGGRRRR